MLTRIQSKSLAIIGSLCFASGALFAQDNGPLVDLLVKKGLLNDQEAEEIKAELVSSFAQTTSAGKLNLSSSLTEFKLSGDVRLRHQEEVQVDQGTTPRNERTRERFRFRFNGDAKLMKGWGAGFALETASAADSGNQTFENGNDDYAISLARAYVTFQPNLNWSFSGGKMKQNLYVTDMTWDGDINPQGFAENYINVIGGKSGKDTIKVRALQNLMDDNNEKTWGPGGRDAWLIAQQLVYTTYFGENNMNNVVLAGGYTTYNSALLAGLGNETAFNGSTKYLEIVHFTGEANFANVGGEGMFLKLYWDWAHNMAADDRVHKADGYALATTVGEDGDAWMLGVAYAKGKGKLQGDWQLKLDYRELGIGAIDPNTSDSDFGFGNLNQRGFKFSAAYNVTNFASVNATYFYTYDKNGTLKQSSVAKLDHSQILQLDLLVKF